MFYGLDSRSDQLHTIDININHCNVPEFDEFEWMYMRTLGLIMFVVCIFHYNSEGITCCMGMTLMLINTRSTSFKY